MAKPNKIIALIMAAGSGERFSADLPKQYQCLAGKPLWRYAAKKFAAHPDITQTFAVIHPDHSDLYRHSVGDLEINAPLTGGATRQESVRLALEAIQHLNPDYVLIHDAARPFVCNGVISRCIAELSPISGCIVALPVHDTLKHYQDDQLSHRERDDLYAAQTPQGFPYSLILQAHQTHRNESVTDDAALAELENIPVKITPGKLKNFKVTTQDDWKMAEAFINGSSEYRTGSGFDVHRFKEGDHVTLGNIKIAFHKGVDAHSDGDVILHALTDAILGAIGENDIGFHFPPSDSKWRNADSAQFVAQAMRLLTNKNGIVINADITLLCEEPKLSPHRNAIKNRIAELLEIAPDRIALKATTTERLGFLGRGEGLAAQAIVTIKLSNE